jgi:polyribonucleotide nucleotidyltransferase
VNKNEITITGEQSAVNKAKALVLDIYEQKKANCTTVSMVIKKPQHKYIIGPKGSALNEFFKSTGVSIEMPSDPTSEQIILRGEQDKIGPALALLYEKAHYVIEAEISVPDWIQKFLIGPKGENFNTLQTEFPNVQVTFEGETNLVKMNGPRHEIEKAKEVFKTEIDNITTQYKIRDITVEARYHRFIIGKSGANIKKIRDETGARIHVPDEGSSNEQQVRIVGSEEAIAKAYEILTDIVQKQAKKEAEVTKELVIEHRFHGQIIGQKGENIREIRDKYNVDINFPKAVLRSDTVKITGDKKNVEECHKHLSEVAKQLLNDNYRFELPINKLFHKTISGKDGAKVRKIRNETETRFDLSDENATVIALTISGKKDNVERAIKLVQELEREVLDLVHQDIIIPHKHHNNLIGANGRLIQSIEQECDNASITFPEAGKQSDKVTIRGTKEGVQKAKAQLLELSKDMALNGHEDHLPCPRQFHKFIIGKGGNNINQLREKYNFRAFVQNEGEGVACDQITLIGKKENVLKAKQELEKLITSLQNTIESTVQVPQKHHLHFVTRKGQVIRDISDEYSNVNISFPAKGAVENPETVVLKGSKECVEGAKARILEIVQNLESQISFSLEIEQVHHKYVLGYRASNLLPIEQKYDVKIRFPKKENEDTPPPTTDEERKARHIITILGRQENCDKAAQDLLDLVPITIEFDVPFEYHGSIIGQKGQFLRSLRDEHNIEVSIPPSDEQSNTIKITGCKNVVEIGKEAILDRVKQLEEQKLEREARNYKQELIVPHEYHNKIIGKKGAIINEIRKAYDVRINFPEKKPFDKGEAPVAAAIVEEEEEAVTDAEPEVDNSRNTIVIIGYEKNVKNAIKRITKIVRELQSQVSIQLKIAKDNYSSLIGRGGKTIRKIMDQFKVNIKFPTDDSDMITVSGTDKNVEACKDHIYQIITDYVSSLLLVCCSLEWFN